MPRDLVRCATLRLYSKQVDDIDITELVVDSVLTLTPQGLSLGRKGVGPTRVSSIPNVGERLEMPPGDPAVANVADDRHPEPIEMTELLAQGEGVDERLRGCSLLPTRR